MQIKDQSVNAYWILGISNFNKNKDNQHGKGGVIEINQTRKLLKLISVQRYWNTCIEWQVKKLFLNISIMFYNIYCSSVGTILNNPNSLGPSSNSITSQLFFSHSQRFLLKQAEKMLEMKSWLFKKNWICF